MTDDADHLPQHHVSKTTVTAAAAAASIKQTKGLEGL
jgi:hypothetical protein